MKTIQLIHAAMFCGLDAVYVWPWTRSGPPEISSCRVRARAAFTSWSGQTNWEDNTSRWDRSRQNLCSPIPGL